MPESVEGFGGTEPGRGDERQCAHQQYVSGLGSRIAFEAEDFHFAFELEIEVGGVRRGAAGDAHVFEGETVGFGAQETLTGFSPRFGYS